MGGTEFIFSTLDGILKVRYNHLHLPRSSFMILMFLYKIQRTSFIIFLFFQEDAWECSKDQNLLLQAAIVIGGCERQVKTFYLI